jgi:hypothetical protein
MKSYEAIQRAVAGKTIEHAKKLHKSAPLLNKWMEPSTDFNDSGTYNPLDRIETIIETSLALGEHPDNALAPIQYLAERFKQILIPVPKTTENMEELSLELLKTISDFGELSKEASESMKDGRISGREAKRIEKDAWELIRQVAVFVEKVNCMAR